MSSALLNYIPDLTPVGAVDITSAQFGSTMYGIFYDQAIVGLGNVLMFEYKLILENVTIPNTTNVTLGFVSIENATNNGISNQWTVAVPSLNDVYDPAISVRIAIRVYVGLTGSSEVGVTNWSNELDVHNPPAEPTIAAAFYDTPSVNADDLFVFLNQDSSIDYNVVKFVAAFYYQDASNNTVWDVSVPIAATLVSSGTYAGNYMLHVPEFGTVSSSQQVMYVSVYAVFEYSYNTSSYYSVSHVSGTVLANPASQNAAPIVTGIDYSVYTAPNTTQNMTVTWTAPNNSSIPTYTVDYYRLYISTDDSTYTLVDGNVPVPNPASPISYVVDVSAYDCGDTLYFRVEAVSTNGTISPPSATTIYSQLNVFKYATAPLNLDITNTTYDNVTGQITMDIAFDTPTDNGCGTPTDFAVLVQDASGNIMSTNYVAYNGSANYVYNFSGIVPQSGIVAVYLITTDTNPSVPGGSTYLPRDGASTSLPYVAVNFVLGPVDYQVYVPPVGSQDMNLSWTNPVNSLPGGWTVTQYDVYYQVTGSNPVPLTLVATITDGSLNYTFDASAIDCGNTVNFRIEATLDNAGVISQVTSNIVYINIFKYATAPLNLDFSNATYNSGIVTMDIAFDTPSDNGCGTPTDFAVIIKDTDGNVTSTNYVAYNGSANYLYNFSGSVTQSGTIEVYLITTDTNPSVPGGSTYLPRDGASTSLPYVAVNFVLDPVDYQVYVPPVGSQYMNLSWNNPVDSLPGGWSVTQYDVYYEVTGTNPVPLTLITTITDGSLNYTFDASAIDCGNTVTFTIVVTLDNAGVISQVTSNTVSINIFKYATAPQAANVLWAVASTDFTTMDIRMTFENPLSTGCGTIVNFVVNVLDASYNLLPVPEATQNVNYVSGSTPYIVNFDNLPIPTPNYGYVEVYMVTQDTNGSGNLNGATIFPPYIAGQLPIYLNVNMNNARTLLTFNVATFTTLAPVAGVVTAIPGNPITLIPTQWLTTGGTTGAVVSYQIFPNNEFYYTVTMTPDLLGVASFPQPLGIVVSNAVGIQEQNADA